MTDQTWQRPQRKRLNGTFVSCDRRALFWEWVDKSGECWIWRGTIVRGYGRFKYNGKGYVSHRLAWELTREPVPSHLRVLHKCDNPPCVRPDHLFVGTQADNVHDMHEKGRDRKASGSRHGMARLTEQDVQAILTSSLSHSQLAALYGVSRGCVGSIKSGRNWRHVKQVAGE